MADSRADVPTFPPMTPSNTLIQNCIYVFVTIVAALVLRRLIVFASHCISSFGDWFIGNFENTRIDDLSMFSRKSITEELAPGNNLNKLSCGGPSVEAGNSSESSAIMGNKEQKYDKDMKDFEDSLNRIIEGKDKKEDLRTMRNSIADYAKADEIDKRFREELAEKNRKFDEESEEIRQRTRSIERLTEQKNQELHCQKSLLPRLHDD